MCNNFQPHEDLLDAVRYGTLSLGRPSKEAIENEKLKADNRNAHANLKIAMENTDAALAQLDQLRSFLCELDPNMDLSKGTVNTAIMEIGNSRAVVQRLKAEVAVLQSKKA